MVLSEMTKIKFARIVVVLVIGNMIVQNNEISLLTSSVVSVVVLGTWRGIAQSTKILMRRRRLPSK